MNVAAICELTCVTRRAITCVAVPVFVLTLLSASAQDIDRLAVRGNPILREALGVNCPYPKVDERNIEAVYRQEWIDQQIDYFVDQVHSKLEAIKSDVKEAQEARTLVIEGKLGENLHNWREALRRTEEQSKDLRSAIANVLTDLSAKQKFELKLAPNAGQEKFGAEMNLLSDQVAEVERFINDYFVKPTHVTSVSDLGGANILDYLKRVEKIARVVRERL